ncbi:LytR/AlgR family response regulator transcription factor [Maribacter sp. 2304DJ31-5]|uniref:LytR/AlgR family response regulator transcription factor n=1 Tax=Maribacter sp. 2304DJ31-5 TaxID=3386273 RepID=UPI0039BC2E37
MNNRPYKTLIIDDEPPARQRLMDLLSHFKSIFEIIGEAANGTEGLKKIRTLQPDIIFLDIQMPGMTGFEMLRSLKEPPMIIFCTAYDSFSLKAFETNSLDYLLKPVKKERLALTVEKLKFFKKEHQSEHLMNLLEQLKDTTTFNKKPTSITVRNGKKITFIKLESIVYFKANDKYVSLFTVNGQEYLTDLTLTQLEIQLSDHFLRVHRSTIINTDMVKEVQPYFSSRYAIAMNDRNGTKIISGRSYLSSLKSWMGL